MDFPGRACELDAASSVQNPTMEPSNIERTVTVEPLDAQMVKSMLRRVNRVSPPEPKIGDVVEGRYELTECLGRGGMGVVFAARDKRTQKSLALKWLTSSALYGSEADRDSALARFEREALIAARTAHPNLVDVYDVSVVPESPFIVMERLHGETLRSRLERGPLSWEDALAIVLPAMRGVAALHRQGVVHRDLKPDNIFLCATQDASYAAVKVLDLGISHEASSVNGQLTKTGALLGTPAYMPLEQLRGERDVGPGVDIYALGVVLYEALSGARPFSARTEADMAVMLATEGPTPLAARLPSLPATRADAVMRALGREAKDRYPTIDAMMQALEAADADVSFLYTKTPRRLLLGSAVLGALVLAMVAVGLIVSRFGGAPAQASPAVADLPPIVLPRPQAPRPTAPVVAAGSPSVAEPESGEPTAATSTIAEVAAAEPARGSQERAPRGGSGGSATSRNGTRAVAPAPAPAPPPAAAPAPTPASQPSSTPSARPGPLMREDFL